jgi:hypothetical protein
MLPNGFVSAEAWTGKMVATLGAIWETRKNLENQYI